MTERQLEELYGDVRKLHNATFYAGSIFDELEDHPRYQSDRCRGNFSFGGLGGSSRDGFTAKLEDVLSPSGERFMALEMAICFANRAAWLLVRVQAEGIEVDQLTVDEITKNRQRAAKVLATPDYIAARAVHIDAAKDVR